MSVTILVVDDEPDLESLITQKFRKQIRDKQYEFLFAQNGIQALARLEEYPTVSMILSDINMPEMDGLTLLSKLKELNNPTLKTVIVSAYGDMENIRVAMNRGAFDFLVKPIDFNDLEVTINKTLDHLKILESAVADRERLIAVQRDLNIATRIQQSILPRTFPPFPTRNEFEILADMIPAKEVGGDFYDFFFIDEDRLAFVIGDVSGKGVPAAIFMAVSRTLLKAIASQVVNPGECLRRINSMLVQESDSAMFVTIFYGVLNTRTGDVQYSNGGHLPPFHLKSDGSADPLPLTGGMLLGMLTDLEYDVNKVRLQPGESIFLYTDGVTEAMNDEKQLFDEERLVQSLRNVNQGALTDIIGKVGTDIQGFAAGAPQSDDITTMVLRYLGKH
jgi:sigma-B regulation protein RsbU (phosphoserine phosphatase)